MCAPNVPSRESEPSCGDVKRKPETVANPPLTDNFIKALTAPAGKRIEIFDQKISGLVLRVSEQGRKTWVVRYRTENGRQPRFTIGTYPTLKLADALDEALKLLAQVKTGDDPASERRKTRQSVQSAPVRCFGELFEAYIDASRKGHWKPKKKQKRERTIAGEEWAYLNSLFATIISSLARGQVRRNPLGT
jgi:hypothetical protein